MSRRKLHASEVFLLRGYRQDIYDIEMLVHHGEPLTKSEQKKWERPLAAEQRKRQRRGRRLKEFRQHLGLSQAKLAKLLGISRRRLCSYESGSQAPRRRIHGRLCWFGYDWREMKVSLKRWESITRLVRVDIGDVSLDDVDRFFRSFS